MSAQRPLWRRWLLPACLALLAVNLVGLVVWTAPRGLRQRNAAARLAAARVEAKEQRAAVAGVRERAAAIRANTADVERFYARVAGSERTDLVPTLEAVETLARSPGLSPGSRSYARSQVKDAPLQRIAISLPLSGSYQQLIGFLREVESSPRFITVDGISMRADEGRATLQVELSTYLRGAAGAGGGGGRRGR